MTAAGRVALVTGGATGIGRATCLELARRVTELGQAPDVLMLADRAVFAKLLVPAHADGYTLFARNRIVLAYGPRARGASEIAGAARWWEVLERQGVEVGRADPATDPSGYRTLLAFQLIERHYAVPGLARRLLAAAPERNVRPREADQIALVEAGALDYVWTYESLARAAQMIGRIGHALCGQAQRLQLRPRRAQFRAGKARIAIHRVLEPHLLLRA